MTRRHAAAATALLSAVLLAGCQAAQDVASDSASAAGAQASESAVRELSSTVCPLVADNDLSDSERSTLDAAIDLAQGLGVESPLLDAAEDVNDSDGTPPESAVAELAAECR
ncbi:hypothetical protein GCM10028777_08680 [Angustibacter speluncae]